MKLTALLLALMLTGCATFKSAITSEKTFVACTALDATTTYYAINHGAVEMNPFMAKLISHGWAPFIAYQAAFVWFIYKLREEYGQLADMPIAGANIVKCGVVANNINFISGTP